MWWEPEKYFEKSWQRVFFIPWVRWLMFWDKLAMGRVDLVVANSKHIASKIKKYYGRKADAIIYPFHSLPKPDEDSKTRQIDNYFLIVTRLSSWKRVDIAVKAFKNKPSLGNLVVVGKGSDKGRLKRLAKGARNVTFLSGLTNSELVGYYMGAQALIVTQEEDFGIVPLESMSQSTPIIAFKKGGVLETVKEGKHGVFFEKQTSASLKAVLKDFSKPHFSKSELKKQAEKFSKKQFQSGLEILVKKYV